MNRFIYSPHLKKNLKPTITSEKLPRADVRFLKLFSYLAVSRVLILIVNKIFILKTLELWSLTLILRYTTFISSLKLRLKMMCIGLCKRIYMVLFPSLFSLIHSFSFLFVLSFPYIYINYICSVDLSLYPGTTCCFSLGRASYSLF